MQKGKAELHILLSKGRLSRTVLRENLGAIPLVYSTNLPLYASKSETILTQSHNYW